MTDVKLKNGVYAVVNVTAGEVVGAARILEHAKLKADSPRDLKLAKMEIQKFIR